MSFRRIRPFAIIKLVLSCCFMFINPTRGRAFSRGSRVWVPSNGRVSNGIEVYEAARNPWMCLLLLRGGKSIHHDNDQERYHFRGPIPPPPPPPPPPPTIGDDYNLNKLKSHQMSRNPPLSTARADSVTSNTKATIHDDSEEATPQKLSGVSKARMLYESKYYGRHSIPSKPLGSKEDVRRCGLERSSHDHFQESVTGRPLPPPPPYPPPSRIHVVVHEQQGGNGGESNSHDTIKNSCIGLGQASDTDERVLRETNDSIRSHVMHVVDEKHGGNRGERYSYNTIKNSCIGLGQASDTDECVLRENVRRSHAMHVVDEQQGGNGGESNSYNTIKNSCIGLGQTSNTDECVLRENVRRSHAMHVVDEQQVGNRGERYSYNTIKNSCIGLGQTSNTDECALRMNVRRSHGIGESNIAEGANLEQADTTGLTRIHSEGTAVCSHSFDVNASSPVTGQESEHLSKLKLSLLNKCRPRVDHNKEISMSSWLMNFTASIGRRIFVAAKSAVMTPKERMKMGLDSGRVPLILIDYNLVSIYAIDDENHRIEATTELFLMYYKLMSIMAPYRVSHRKIEVQDGICPNPKPADFNMTTTCHQSEMMVIPAVFFGVLASRLMISMFENDKIPASSDNILENHTSHHNQQVKLRREKTVITRTVKNKPTMLSELDTDKDLDDIDFSRLISELEGYETQEQVIETIEYECNEELIVCEHDHGKERDIELDAGMNNIAHQDGENKEGDLSETYDGLFDEDEIELLDITRVDHRDSFFGDGFLDDYYDSP